MPTPSLRRSALLLVLVLAASLLAAVPSLAQPGIDAAPLASADGQPDAVIRRTSFGIPHIVARDWTSLGFGHGYSTAEDSICVLADTVLAGQGERSRFLGADGIYDDQVTLRATNLQVDALVGSLRQRGVVEALLEDPVAGPSDRAKALVEGYVGGVNRFLEEIGGPEGIDDPACAGAEWVRPADALDLWYGVYLANLLASTGVFVPQITEATPPSPDDPGEPVDPCVLGAPLPTCSEEARAEALAGIDRDALLTALGRDPDSPFGSNGTALGRDVTTTGRGMVLGNPHFPWRGRYSFHQAQLTIPGVYDVAGASLHGSPVINIGWNRDVAWTHTVSTGYRFTPYEYRLVPGSPTTYLTESGPQEMAADEVVIDVLTGDGSIEQVSRTLYRTDEGFVLDAPEIFLGWSAASAWALRDANAEHLKTIDSFLEMGEASSVAELAAAQDRTAGIPWVNTMAADRDGDVLYADNSVVPNVTDEQVQKCATPAGQVLVELAGLPGLDGTRAAGACAWGSDDDAARPGIFGPANLPDTTRTDWVVNANDSYWLPNPAEPLEGFDRIIGCEQCERTLRTRLVYRYVLDRLAGVDDLAADGEPNLFTHEQLKAVEVANRVFAGELARFDDDLTEVCAASGVRAEACDVLAAWDGRSNIDSVGTILFREFWNRAPAAWTVAFDAADPVNTPRDLEESDADVQQAMVDAVAALDEAGIALDAPLGSQQVAGDNGAVSAGIPVHGGPAGTGNANVVSTREIEGIDARYPIAYGSSHIQAVAFTDEGVNASTILTYGNSANAASARATDQTRLWSQERWVDWAFTTAEQLADPGFSAYRVGGDVDRAVLSAEDAGIDPLAPGLRVQRVAGADRIATAVAVSERTFAVADTVVIATAGSFPDALAGAPLATSVGGPLLLTGSGRLDDRVAGEITRLGADHAILLGGTSALSPAVSSSVEATGLTVERLAGADRFSTAAAIAGRVGSPLAFLASGEDFADAVTAAGIAAALGAPVVLTARGSLPSASAEALAGRSDVVVAGGVAAVSDVVVEQVRAGGATVARVAGEDRYSSAVALLRAALDRGLTPEAVWLATGSSFADALAAAAAAGTMGTGVLLVDDGATQPAMELLDSIRPSTLLVAGGPAVVGDDVVAAARP